MFYFDPIYFLFLAPAILLAGYAQLRVKSAYAETRSIAAQSGLSGAEVASLIVKESGITGVGIEVSEGVMSDHYDPKAKMLRLSPDVYYGRSLASLGIAAHEVGHALQDAKHYPLLSLRNAIVPMASFGSNAAWFLMLIGTMLQSMQWILLGIALFSLAVIFQIVNLPVEFDASARAKRILLQRGFITSAEAPAVNRVLGAAALTYVAATITAVLQLVYYLYRFGLLGAQDD